VTTILPQMGPFVNKIFRWSCVFFS
jgi:hypothetical protein